MLEPLRGISEPLDNLVAIEPMDTSGLKGWYYTNRQIPPGWSVLQLVGSTAGTTVDDTEASFLWRHTPSITPTSRPCTILWIHQGIHELGHRLHDSIPKHQKETFSLFFSCLVFKMCGVFRNRVLASVCGGQPPKSNGISLCCPWRLGWRSGLPWQRSHRELSHTQQWDSESETTDFWGQRLFI